MFLEPDPLGPVDSPNLYQAFGFDGMNVVDPWGMETKMIGLRAGRPILENDQEVIVFASEHPENQPEASTEDELTSENENDTEPTITEKLESQPKEGQMVDVLFSGFVEPFIPCAEPFRVRYDRSLLELREGTNEGLMSLAGMGAKSRGGVWVANRVGTSTVFGYGRNLWKSGLRTFSVRAAGGALASSTLGGLLVEPAFRIGVKAGAAINVQIVEPYLNPCRRADYEKPDDPDTGQN